MSFDNPTSILIAILLLFGAFVFYRTVIKNESTNTPADPAPEPIVGPIADPAPEVPTSPDLADVHAVEPMGSRKRVQFLRTTLNPDYLSTLSVVSIEWLLTIEFVVGSVVELNAGGRKNSDFIELKVTRGNAQTASETSSVVEAIITTTDGTIHHRTAILSSEMEKPDEFSKTWGADLQIP